ncbi:hypothetical protein R0135_09100 [Congregibacter variabilis]|uniref:Uncharacterized protein n=1 Tax=Congregibacter variabilis TaxID=3081200 RepID=A0ABZ0HYD5_9GAMM|nr:hypothetical protein R0135_09100 [Congregibacter sp. IMCC43200]
MAPDSITQENLLERRTDGVALIGPLENGGHRAVSWNELRDAVALQGRGCSGILTVRLLLNVLSNCVFGQS